LRLRIIAPADRSIVTETPVQVRGMTSPGASALVKGREATVSYDGAFNVPVDLEPGSNVIPVNVVLGSQNKSQDLTVEYRPPLRLQVSGISENMETSSPELSVDVEVSAGAKFSVNGKEGSSSVRLNPGRNVVTVRAWDSWNNRQEKTYSVNYKAGGKLSLSVASPASGSVITEPLIIVTGNATPGSQVTVNNAMVTVSGGGSFSTQIPIPDEPQDYTIEVRAAMNDEEVSVERSVTYKPKSGPLILAIGAPVDGQKIVQPVIRVQGKTSAGAKVLVNDRPAVVTPQGMVSAEIQLREQDIGDYSLEIVASNENEEVTKSMVLTVDPTSPAINTSVPLLVVEGAGQQATRNGRLTVQVSDRTPDDQITLQYENNGSTDEEQLDPNVSTTVSLSEGVNKFSVKASDRAKNQSNVVAGDMYYLPGPLQIDMLDPSTERVTVEDLPPLPRGVERPKLRMKIKIDDGIGDVPRTIRYCRIMGGGQNLLMKDNGDYTFSSEIILPPGLTVYALHAEDLAGNTVTKNFTVDIR
jgi:hypothetical protein